MKKIFFNLHHSQPFLDEHLVSIHYFSIIYTVTDPMQHLLFFLYFCFYILVEAKTIIHHNPCLKSHMFWILPLFIAKSPLQVIVTNLLRVKKYLNRFDLKNIVIEVIVEGLSLTFLACHLCTKFSSDLIYGVWSLCSHQSVFTLKQIYF